LGRDIRDGNQTHGEAKPVARYVIERDFGQVTEDEMQEVAARSKVTAAEHFPDITWEHSHVCINADGAIKSFCIYEAPDTGRLRDHADAAGGHTIAAIYEIVGDIDPEGVKV
jgi:hypothetical protein